jgi:hypothetical protein
MNTAAGQAGEILEAIEQIEERFMLDLHCQRTWTNSTI